ncbi:aldo/keto reductase [Amycolatopsis jiangsuensis]|uniref:Aryl-alcohol dehydrogenase-like predicted oxidoreductase n=1 Tax=Amycolatopsis jiangsuensis TaxID=1181879 RepID=A0A840IQG7_9PSEU|nr:aldo/keto reductase [Amycolatopsis jiangsuensis]MBB4683695.1 aryl-alcohol dehydrogenase-like predicted oxidoreductase [Amycolatopsis jiangsuensis]
MEQRILGATGMSVSVFGLGAMMLGSLGNTDHDEAVRMVHRALEAGVTLIDTADVYSRGESEEIVGRALRGRRDEVVLATKFGRPMGEDPNRRGASRRWIVRAVEDSLRRLRTDHLDLYQLHRPDHATPPGETLQALTDLVRAGKIRAFGASMVPPELIVEAQWAAHEQRSHRFLTEQTMYSIFTRRPEAAVFPTVQRHGMGVLAFSPLNSGWLSGKADLVRSHRAGLMAPVLPTHYDPSTPTGAAKTAALAELTVLAGEAGLTLPQLATAFVRAHPAVTTVLLGPRTPDQLDSLLTGTGTTLPGDVLDRIDEIVPPGTDLDPADTYAATPPALEDATLRRR